ncbi:MAG: signal recognition particle-docking protein FtsY [Bacteroidetes bacterium]|nr:signal recognition particle-docking protein FtsY [Bacteroidota bacterium]
MSFFKRLFSKEKKEKLDLGLERTREGFFGKLARLVTGRATIDDDMLDELEEVLITSDVGVATTEKIIQRVQERVRKERAMPADQLQVLLREEIANLLVSHGGEDQEEITIPKVSEGPYVIMVVGVNGVGKTTTIGKIAYQLNQQGKKVMLGAADTFRAAAIDQLKVWAERAQVDIIAQNMGADPAAVAFDTLQSAVAKNADVVIIDTAGRLHNKVNLMNELTKIKRVMQKVVPNAPHDVMLVLDGSTGQNAFEQARQFTAATEVTSLAITKIDGTAKGGVVIGISDQFSIPVRFIGVGEKAEDLQVFNRFEFVDSLFAQKQE